MIEPVFANTKFNRKITRFRRRGRAAVRTEWRLITATHNLVKLHNHQLAAASGLTAPASEPRPLRRPPTDDRRFAAPCRELRDSVPGRPAGHLSGMKIRGYFQVSLA
jgi:Transposase DDE domain